MADTALQKQDEGFDRLNKGVSEWLDSDEIAVFEADIDEQIESAGSITSIPSQEAYAIAVGVWKHLGKLRKAVTAHFATVIEPINAVHKKLTTARGGYEKRLKEEEDRVNKLCIGFVRAQEAKKAADEQRDREAAAEEEKKQREAAAAGAASPAEAEAIQNAPSAAPPPTRRTADYVPPGTGAATRRGHKAQIEDIAVFLEAIAAEARKPAGERRISIPECFMGFRLNSSGGITNTYLNAQARTTNGKWVFPGVKLFDDSKLAATR